MAAIIALILRYSFSFALEGRLAKCAVADEAVGAGAAMWAIGIFRVLYRGLIIENRKRKNLRRWMEEEICKIGDVMIIGQNSKRLPNTSNIAVRNIRGLDLLFHLSKSKIYVSTGSACNSISVEPSHVLTAMAVPIEYQHSIRVSLSAYTTGDEICDFVNTFKEIVKKLRRR